MTSPVRMSTADTALLVIDVQEKLIGKIHGAASLVRNLDFLLDAAKLLGIAVLATEQYPKGLGGTVASIAPKLPVCWEKTAFSCCAVPEVTQTLHRDARLKVLLAGIETHVCVQQTALDLLARDFYVFLAVDTLGSRALGDHDAAVRRMEQAGAIVTTCESAVFEWMGGSKAPHFKEISQLVQQRSKAMAGSG